MKTDVQRRSFYRQEQAYLLEWGFSQPYVGDALERFLEVVHHCHEEYDPKQHYGRVIPILQSSAYKKSRLIKELAKQVSVSLLQESRFGLCSSNENISFLLGMPHQRLSSRQP